MSRCLPGPACCPPPPAEADAAAAADETTGPGDRKAELIIGVGDGMGCLLTDVGGSCGEAGIEAPKCFVSFICVVSNCSEEKLSLHQTHLKMSLLLSGPLLSHWDCQADGRDPPGTILEPGPPMGDTDPAGLGLEPLAISLIRSKGFFKPPASKGEGGVLATEDGMPNCSLVKASGVRLPAANKGCKKGHAVPSNLSSPNFGILASFLLPDKSRGDSVGNLGEADLGFDEAAERLRPTPANEAATEVSMSVSSCLRFRTLLASLSSLCPEVNLLMASAEAAAVCPPPP